MQAIIKRTRFFGGREQVHVFTYFPEVRGRMLMVLGNDIVIGCISNGFRLKLVYVIIVNP